MFLLLELFFLAILIVFLLFTVLLLYIYLTPNDPDNFAAEEENYYQHPILTETIETNKKNNNNKKKLEKWTKKRFPSINDKPLLSLSVIVPAYNEEERLPLMMDEAVEFLENKQKKDINFSYEIIIVDDGSQDNTTQVGLKYTLKYGSEKIRVLKQIKNRGKGGAIKMGVLRSRGQLILFADADGATKFYDINNLINIYYNYYNNYNKGIIVCGSRSHLEIDSIVKRSIFRTILMYIFHLLVYFLCVKSIKDTQCGFKLFDNNIAKILFYNLHVYRWAFDVDLLFIAEKFKIKIKEIPVNWTEIPGSKLSPVSASIQMAKDLLFIRLRYLTGSWKIKKY